MECAEACRNFTASSTPPSGCTNVVACQVKPDNRTLYTCGKPGSDAMQTCHAPVRKATGKATNKR